MPAPQVWQAAPPVPQLVLVVPPRQIAPAPVPEQQPLGQFAALHPVWVTHAWFWQLWVPLQTAQALPPVPQAEFRLPELQTPLLQQPVGQFWAVQPPPTHWPPVQVCEPV